MDSLPINFFFALLLSLPFFFYQLWLFIKPALYPNEKSILAWFLLMNGGLFYSRIGLGYQFVLPLFLHFFIHATPTSILLLPTIESYQNFTLSFLLLLGVLFDIPLWMALLVKLKHLRVQTLRSTSESLFSRKILAILAPKLVRITRRQWPRFVRHPARTRASSKRFMPAPTTMTLRRDVLPASPSNPRLSRALRLRIAFAMLSLSHRSTLLYYFFIYFSDVIDTPGRLVPNSSGNSALFIF